MHDFRRWRAPLAAIFLVLAGLCARPAGAVIEVLIPLGSLIGDSDAIFLAQVEKLDPAKPGAVFMLKKSIKGKAPWERLPVNLTGDKEKNTPALLKRMAVDQPVVICVKKQEKGQYMLLAFTNGTWFQVLGQPDGEQTRFAFTHCEPYLRRTFKGTTDELVQVVTDVVAGKGKAPPPFTKEPPGLGPELPEK